MSRVVGGTDRQRDMTKPIVAFRNFAEAPKYIFQLLVLLNEREQNIILIKSNFDLTSVLEWIGVGQFLQWRKQARVRR